MTLAQEGFAQLVVGVGAGGSVGTVVGRDRDGDHRSWGWGGVDRPRVYLYSGILGYVWIHDFLFLLCTFLVAACIENQRRPCLRMTYNLERGGCSYGYPITTRETS